MDCSPSHSSTGSSRFTRRNYEKFKLEGPNKKGPSCPRPARAPAGTTAAAARLRGTRRTCPFRCGSLCLAGRRFWIAGFSFLPGWAPLHSLSHPVPGGPNLPPPVTTPSPKAQACRETSKSSLEVAPVIPLSCSPSFVV